MVGYAVVILMLVMAMGIAIAHVERVTTAQITRIRDEEHRIALAERLRWTGEQLVAAGRAYLLAGSPTLLQKLTRAELALEQDIAALEQRLAPDEVVVALRIAAAAREFSRVQQRLVMERRHGDTAAAIAERFEIELLPLRRDLSATLDRLILHKEEVIDAVYHRARGERSRLMSAMHGLLALLAIAGLGVAWYFTRGLSRAYRAEHDALEVSRRAVAARDALMATVAHDLRTPLQSIMLRAEHLRLSTSDDTARAHAESIENVSTRMEHLIRSMLDVALIDAERFTLQTEVSTVDDLVATAVEMFAPLADSRKVQLIHDRQAAGLVIRADRERFLQVLSNLLGNAIKFTPKQGRVAVAVTEDAGCARISISDTGPGIAAADIPHLFQRFWKRDQEGTKGTGLGLFIAKTIVEAHGGQLRVESEPGRGATFHVEVPLVSPASGQPGAEVHGLGRS